MPNIKLLDISIKCLVNTYTTKSNVPAVFHIPPLNTAFASKFKKIEAYAAKNIFFYAYHQQKNTSSHKKLKSNQNSKPQEIKYELKFRSCRLSILAQSAFFMIKTLVFRNLFLIHILKCCICILFYYFDFVQTDRLL